MMIYAMSHDHSRYQEAEMALLGTAYGNASLSIDDFKASNGMAYALMGDICRYC
jgi:hypothetical protein